MRDPLKETFATPTFISPQVHNELKNNPNQVVQDQNNKRIQARKQLRNKSLRRNSQSLISQLKNFKRQTSVNIRRYSKGSNLLLIQQNQKNQAFRDKKVNKRYSLNIFQLNQKFDEKKKNHHLMYEIEEKQSRNQLINQAIDLFRKNHYLQNDILKYSVSRKIYRKMQKIKFLKILKNQVENKNFKLALKLKNFQNSLNEMHQIHNLRKKQLQSVFQDNQAKNIETMRIELEFRYKERGRMVEFLRGVLKNHQFLSQLQIMTNQEKGTAWTWIIRLAALGLIFQVGMYVYESFYPTLRDDLDVYVNELAENGKYRVLIHLIDGQKKLLMNKEYQYSDGLEPLKYEMKVSDIKDVNNAYLAVNISYKDFSGKIQRQQCNQKLTEKKQERLRDKDAGVDGVMSKDSLGEKKLHYYSKVYFNLIYDKGLYQENMAEFRQLYYQNSYQRNQQFYFRPFLDCLQIWVQNVDKIPLDKKNENSSIKIEFGNYPSWKFQQWLKIYIGEQQTNSWAHDAKAFEDIKGIFLDNSPFYLVILFSVNILHTLFSLLSVKNKISFWRSEGAGRGISQNQYFLDSFYQIVIILYLIDNEASILVILITTIESLVTFWISFKILSFEKRPDGKFPYFRLKQPQDKFSQQTQKYESEITSILYKILLPLLTLYVLYTFANKNSLSYYSWFLKSLVSFIYIIGFINMTPQIYINYKLQSVEHMPWNAMIYQFLNTIIDDLFAFAVKIPTLQKMSVFRDDIIFVIFLYQMWKYRKNKRKEKVE